MKTYIVEDSFGPYNARRYSRPWGAKITLDASGKAQYLFDGQFLGQHSAGHGEGVVQIAVEPGDVVAFGQKDNRGNKTDNRWYIVDDQGVVDIDNHGYITKKEGVDHLRRNK